MSVSFWHWAKNVGTFTKKLSARGSYLLLRVPGNVLGNNSFSKRKKFFSSSDIEWSFFRLLWKLFGGPAKTVIHLSKGTIWEKYFPWKKHVFFIQFRKNTQKSSALWLNFFNGISRRACYLSKKDILIKFFMGMFSQVTVIEPARHFLTSVKKIFCRFVINAPYLSTSPFGWFWVLLEKDHCFSINFGHQFRNLFPDFYRKVFSWIFRSCVLRIQKNIYRDFFRKCFLVSFGY